MTIAKEGCRPWLGVAVQAEVAAALRAAVAAGEDRRELQECRGRSESDPEVVCCTVDGFWIFGSVQNFLLPPVMVALSGLVGLYLGWWWFQEGDGDACGGRGWLRCWGGNFWVWSECVCLLLVWECMGCELLPSLVL